MTLQKPSIVLFDMDGTTVRHVRPWVLHLLEKLDDIAHKIAKLCSFIFNRRFESPTLVEFRHGKRKKLLVHRMDKAPMQNDNIKSTGIYFCEPLAPCFKIHLK